ncbi:MAG: nitroreductase family protein [Bacillota bacterium]
MELFSAVTSRRSVRRFKPDLISREIVIKILDAANKAPSATNRQPWSFIVLEAKDIDDLRKLSEEAFDERFSGMPKEEAEKKLSRLSLYEEDKYEGLNRFYRTLGDAPVVIVVTAKLGDSDYDSMLNTASASAAVQNLLLAAWDFGLGSCWMMGPLQRRNEEIRKLLFVPENEHIIALVPVGYPDKIPPEPIKEKVDKKIRWGL